MTTVEDGTFEDFQPTRRARCERFDLRCPDCGDFLRLIPNKTERRLFYGCRQWAVTGCKGNHSANDDGSPRGIPADAETRKWRKLAHESFDHLWSGDRPPMTKKEAYFWMAMRLNLSLNQRDRGIGCLSREQCGWLIEAVKREFPQFRTAWDRLGDESF